MSKETEHTLRQGLARSEREAGPSPVTEVIGAVHQDDHAVHCDDPDDQQAEGTDLEGRREAGMVSHTPRLPHPGLSQPLTIKLPLG